MTEDAGEIEVAEESASEDEGTACEVSVALGSGWAEIFRRVRASLPLRCFP